MRDITFAASPPPRIFHPQASALPLEMLSESSSPTAGNPDLLEILRQSVNDESQSTESLLTAIADAARVLSGATGTAVALHSNGIILCRARSGPMAPQIGSPLKADSGISGECLRSAAIQVCSDALRDTRVDRDVCRDLGIRSIAVVPLRGRLGMAGILEAFSAQPGTFGNEQIHCLRSLGEIAERAYMREQKILQTPTRKASVRAAWSAVVAEGLRRGPALLSFAKKNHRILAAVAAVLIVVSVVVRMSWRQTQEEIAASEAASGSKTASAATRNDQPMRAAPRVVALSPGSRIPGSRSDGGQSGNLLHRAADLSGLADRPSALGVRETEDRRTIISPGTGPATKRSSDATFSEEPAPTVDLEASSESGALAGVVTSTPALPRFGGPVSQNVTPASVIHRVEPTYPTRARVERLAGSVILDVTVAEDGTVRSTNVVSGAPALAEAAAAAVRKWRYTPARLDGKPAQSQTRITIVFKMP